MSDKYKEHLSHLMDGDISEHDKLIDKLLEDKSLSDTWSRFHLIRDVMTNHFVNSGHPDVADRVQRALQDEPTVLAPRRWREPIQAFFKQSAGFAIAASVAAVSVLAIQQYRNPQALNPGYAENDTQKKVVVVSTRVSPGVETKLSGYLVNHNEYSASSKMQGMLPYMRIVGFAPTRRVGNEP